MLVQHMALPLLEANQTTGSSAAHSLGAGLPHADAHVGGTMKNDPKRLLRQTCPQSHQDNHENSSESET